MAFNQLTAAEAERLALLAEECSEVVQAVTKILRHGYDSEHPQSGIVNRHQLADEMGQVRAVMEMLVVAGDVKADDVLCAQEEKRVRVLDYLHHQRKAKHRG